MSSCSSSIPPTPLPSPVPPYSSSATKQPPSPTSSTIVPGLPTPPPRGASDILSISDSQLAQKYLFVKECGFGNWGSVWKVIPKLPIDKCGTSPSMENQLQQKNTNVLAVKLVHRSKSPTTGSRVRSLWTEFKIVRTLKRDSHPNIIHFHDFIISPTYALVSMDYHPRLLHVKLPEEKARIHIRELLSAVDHLHSRGITHNDIKPTNLLVSSDNRVVLCDFGFAQIYRPPCTTPFLSNSSWGTPEYLSPERAKGKPHDDRLSDIFSLGVTLYEMVVGRTPFERNEQEEFLNKEALEIYYQRTLLGEFWGVVNISSALVQLVRAMIQPNPSDRLDSCRKASRFSFLTQGPESYEETARNMITAPFSKTIPSPPASPEPLLTPAPLPTSENTVKELSKWSKYTSPSVRILVDSSNKVPTVVKSPHATLNSKTSSSIPISTNSTLLKRKPTITTSTETKPIKVYKDTTATTVPATRPITEQTAKDTPAPLRLKTHRREKSLNQAVDVNKPSSIRTHRRMHTISVIQHDSSFSSNSNSLVDDKENSPTVFEFGTFNNASNNGGKGVQQSKQGRGAATGLDDIDEVTEKQDFGKNTPTKKIPRKPCPAVSDDDFKTPVKYDSTPKSHHPSVRIAATPPVEENCNGGANSYFTPTRKPSVLSRSPKMIKRSASSQMLKYRDSIVSLSSSKVVLSNVKDLVGQARTSFKRSRSGSVQSNSAALFKMESKNNSSEEQHEICIQNPSFSSSEVQERIVSNEKLAEYAAQISEEYARDSFSNSRRGSMNRQQASPIPSRMNTYGSQSNSNSLRGNGTAKIRRPSLTPSFIDNDPFNHNTHQGQSSSLSSSSTSLINPITAQHYKAAHSISSNSSFSRFSEDNKDTTTTVDTTRSRFSSDDDDDEEEIEKEAIQVENMKTVGVNDDEEEDTEFLSDTSAEFNSIVPTTTTSSSSCFRSATNSISHSTTTTTTRAVYEECVDHNPVVSVSASISASSSPAKPQTNGIHIVDQAVQNLINAPPPQPIMVSFAPVYNNSVGCPVSRMASMERDASSSFDIGREEIQVRSVGSSTLTSGSSDNNSNSKEFNLVRLGSLGRKLEKFNFGGNSNTKKSFNRRGMNHLQHPARSASVSDHNHTNKVVKPPLNVRRSYHSVSMHSSQETLNEEARHHRHQGRQSNAINELFDRLDEGNSDDDVNNGDRANADFSSSTSPMIKKRRFNSIKAFFKKAFPK